MIADNDNWTKKDDLPSAAIELAPADYVDPVIEAYKKHVDRTLLRENLKLTVEQRLKKAQSFHESLAVWREAGRLARAKNAPETK
jgi:hypothetical protein